MRIFVKVDLGYYPATWPIEDQAWYDALLVECGLLDVQTRFVPEGDEISQAQALGIAVANIKSNFGDTSDVTDESTYLRFMEYRQMIPEGVPLPRKWYRRYEALLPTLNSYDYVIATDGTIEEAGCQQGIQTTDQVQHSWQVTDYFSDTYGQHYWEWSQELWMALQRDLERVVEKGTFARVILRQQYGKPDTQSISLDKAVEAAINAIVEQGLLSRAEIETNYNANALYLIGTSHPVWKICFSKMLTNGPYIVELWHAEVNAYTGDVQNIVYDDNREIHPWFEPYILIETLQDNPQEMPSNG
jgi:hypothetical protein